MMQAAKEWLRERQVGKAQLLVRETNTSVVGFYEHLGFEAAPRVVMGKWGGRRRILEPEENFMFRVGLRIAYGVDTPQL